MVDIDRNSINYFVSYGGHLYRITSCSVENISTEVIDSVRRA